MPNKLKPCPFCGGKAIFYSYDPFDGFQGNWTMYVVKCTSCAATVKGVKAEIVKSTWNRGTDNA